jgi:hypothetical protein
MKSMRGRRTRRKQDETMKEYEKNNEMKNRKKNKMKRRG